MKKAVLTLLISIISLASMAQMPAECEKLMNEYQKSLQQGNLPKATEQCRKAREIMAKSIDQKYNGDYFNIVQSLGECYMQAHKLPEAIECYSELAEAMEDYGDNSSNNYFLLLATVSQLQTVTNKKDEALASFHKLFDAMAETENVTLPNSDPKSWKDAGIKAREILKSANSWVEVTIENNAFVNIGQQLINNGESNLAVEILKMTCEGMESRNMTNTQQYVVGAHDLGMAYSSIQDYGNAYQALSNALNASKVVYGPNNPMTMQINNNLMKARAISGSATETTTSKPKKGDERNLDYLMEQFYVNYYASKYVEAARFGDKSIDILRTMSGNDISNENTMSFLNNVGNAHVKTGRTQNALNYYKEVIQIMENNGATSSPSYVVILENISNIYSRLNDYQSETHTRTKAMRLLAQIENVSIGTTDFKTERQELTALSEKLIDNADKFTKVKLVDQGLAFVANANLLINLGYPESGIKIMNQLFNKLDETIGRNNQTGFALLRILGLYYMDKELWSDSQRYLVAADLVAIQVYGDNSYEHALTMELLSVVYNRQKKYDNALAYLNKSGRILKESIGENNDEYINHLCSVLSIYQKTDSIQQAATCFAKIMELRKQQIAECFKYMTTAERQNYFTNKLEQHNNQVFWLGYKLPYESKYKSLIYDYELLCKGLLLSSETEFNNFIRNSNNPSIKKLADELYRNGEIIKAESGKPESKRIANYNELRIRNSEIERELVTMSSELGDLSQNIGTSWQDVKKSLGANDVAIEFINNEFGDYMAIVITSKLKQPEIIPLFKERELKRSMAQEMEEKEEALKSISQISRDLNSANATKIKMDIMPYETSKLYENIWQKLNKFFTPGCTIYFAPKGIIHTLAIEYAPYGNGELFMNRYNVKRISSTRYLTMKKRPYKNMNATILGGIEYTYKYNGQEINYLPGTLEELKEINNCMVNNGVNTTPITGTDATTEKFMCLSGKDANILHIATHGIFREAENNSLENSGLAFSDAILTSAKISEMDLSNTNLVVLSACETAKGNVNGDGVFGLQRAFKLAGCKSLIMSLWPVNDHTTRMLMTDFYNNIYSQKMDEREAFYKAINNLRAVKGTTSFNWAAFIMLD